VRARAGARDFGSYGAQARAGRGSSGGADPGARARPEAVLPPTPRGRMKRFGTPRATPRREDSPMRSNVSFLLLTAACAVASFAGHAQQAESPRHGELTALDYFEIQQLVASYARAIDTCSNNGYDYAD